MNDTKPGGNISRIKNPQKQGVPWWRNFFWLLIILFLVWQWAGIEKQQQLTLSYSEFKAKVRDDDVATITFQGDRIIGDFKSPIEQKLDQQQAPVRFMTTRPPIDDPELIALLEKHKVEVHAQSEQAQWWLQALIGIVPWLLIIGLFWYSGRKMQERLTGKEGPGGIFSFGKSKAKRFRQGVSNVSFDDVDLNHLSGLTVGFSGADLENLINEAALMAGRDNKDQVGMVSLLNARDKVVLGGKREMILSDDEKSWSPTMRRGMPWLPVYCRMPTRSIK